MQTRPTAQPPRPEFSPAPFLIQPWNFTDINICPNASSYFYRLAPDQPEILAPISCKTWTCRSCAQTKIRRLAAKTVLAAPNRLLTLTINPAKFDSPRAAFEATAHQVPELIRMLRTKFGSIDYLRVTEQTKKGWPHYHLLVRSNFLPHAVVKAIWEKLTGATIVDLRQVEKSFSAFTYLVKYLSKMHSLDWTERHCSYSKCFFPPEPENTTPYPKPISSRRDPIHPVVYLAVWFSGRELTRIGYSAWKLDAEPYYTMPENLDHQAWRIPEQPLTHVPDFYPPEKPVTQQPLPITKESSHRHDF